MVLHSADTTQRTAPLNLAQQPRRKPGACRTHRAALAADSGNRHNSFGVASVPPAVGSGSAGTPGGLRWLSHPRRAAAGPGLLLKRDGDSPPGRLCQSVETALRAQGRTWADWSARGATPCAPLERIAGELRIKKTKFEMLLLLVGLLTLHCGF